MKQINSSDTLFITITHLGSTVANKRISGVNSLADVITSVRGDLQGLRGMMSINMRNFSQGWNTSCNFTL